MANHYDIVIIGASSAGTTAAEAAVHETPGLSVLLISEEARLPYKRTKISKSFAGGFERDEFALFDRAWYDTHNVELRTNTRVVKLDPGAREVVLAGGERVHYSAAVLAAGARPRTPDVPASLLPYVHYAHAIEQIDRIVEDARRAEQAIVVGMGVLGVEVSEQLRRMGLTVHLVGQDDRLMPQYFEPDISDRIAGLFRDKGIKLYFNEPDQELREEEGQFVLRLRSSEVEVPGDMAVYAIGLESRCELAEAAGLSMGRAVTVDETLRTSAGTVFAAGDVAEHGDGRVTHLWRHALHQGEVAGRNAARLAAGTGELERYRFVPFRFKCKLFGHYFFTLCVPDPESRSAFEQVEYADGERYVRAFLTDGRVAGLTMVDDLENEKAHRAAVHEGWSRERFERELRLGEPRPAGRVPD